MNWAEIQDRWPEIKRNIRKDHPDLDTDALEQTEQGRRQLLQLIDTKYGAAAPVAEDAVEKVANERRDSDV